MLFTTSIGSRSRRGIASGSWLIATLPELYSIRSLGGELCDARQRQQRMACQLVADRERF
jgi:hypothetical protein